MSAVKRRVFNVLAAVSLVLCAAAGVLWVGSYLVEPAGPMVSFGSASGTVYRALPLTVGPNRFTFVGSERGRVLFIEQSSGPPTDASHCGVLAQPDSVVVYSPLSTVRDHGLFGFGRASLAMFTGSATTVTSIPFWAVVLATLALPASALRWRLRERRRLREGLCPNCGYDLRATPDCCPECGTAVAPAA
jgi:hypothetical protein